jgi:hypothetical protein
MELRRVIWIYCLSCAVAFSYAATINSTNCSLAAVQSAVSQAGPGDTVNVPSGTCTWTSTLDIDKGIDLIGTGMGATTIRNNAGGEYLINYDPADYSRNDPIRISGFTFDLDNKGPGIHLGAHAKSPPFTVQTKARIDHNRFYNAPNSGFQAIWNRGTVRGVVDSNVFEGIAYPMRADPGVGGSSWWDYFPIVQHGIADENLYFEDNNFTGVSLGIVSDCQWSGRYVFRYNTISIPPAAHGSYPLFDMHGNQPGGGEMYSCFGGEIYGNKIDAGIYGVDLLDQRGGRALVFGNSVTAGDGAYIQVREEYSDSPTTNPVPQHVTQSYYWNNWNNRSGTLTRIEGGESQDCCNAIAEDSEYYNTAVPFDGTAGIGCGRLADRPSTCTAGVGYWVTEQSCSSLTGMVGANSTSKISGTLYRCTATNTWTAYFTPLAYPHPLREGNLCTPYCAGKSCGDDGCGGSCPPGCPSGQSCMSGVCQSACAHAADTDCKDCISITELNAYIGQWLSGSAQISDLMDAIRLWKAGCQ